MDEYRQQISVLCDQEPNNYALNWLHEINSYKIKVIFGVGEHGKNWINLLKSYNVKIDYLCDNNKDYWGQQISELPCIAPNELHRVRGDKTVILIAIRKYQSVYEQLMQMGFNPMEVIVASTDLISFKANYIISHKPKSYIHELCKAFLSIVDICEDELSIRLCYSTLKKWLIDWDEVIDYTGEAYFIPEVGRREHEVFVDGGAYNGDTLESFLNVYNESFDKYYAFEMDQINAHNLYNKVENMADSIRDKICIYGLGLWSEKREICYSSNYQTSKIETQGEHKGIVDSLDHILENEKITFIKMDIEGAEIDALKGSIELIHRNMPILAISIYHSINDFISIPLMLKRLGYKIIIRHHAFDDSDIVCYGYVDGQ